MNKNEIDYTLYLCTDRKILRESSNMSIEEAVEQAILGGCSVIQLREKESSSKEFYQTAVSVKKITSKYQVPLIINDRVDIAMAVEADGVHLGQSDLPAKKARELMGKDAVIGVSARNIEAAKKAEKDGADYIGVGAVYPTGTKKDTVPVTKEQLKEIRNQISIPMVAIGGIDQERAGSLKGTGVDGIAVVSAVMGAQNIEIAARQLRKTFCESMGKR